MVTGRVLGNYIVAVGGAGSKVAVTEAGGGACVYLGAIAVDVIACYPYVVGGGSPAKVNL